MNFALSNKGNWSKDNTRVEFNESTNCSTVFLHGHSIATYDHALKAVKISSCGNETLTTKSTNQVTASTTKVDLRGRARQAVVRLESDDDATTNERLGVGWRLGDMRLNTRSDGRR